MDRDRSTHLVVKYQPCGRRSQGWPLRDIYIINGNRTGREA
jgi:hypothetical protein